MKSQYHAPKSYPQQLLRYQNITDNDFLFRPTIPVRTLDPPIFYAAIWVNEIMFPEDVLHRFSHVTVTWKNSIIVWGVNNFTRVLDPSEVVWHSSGKWFRKSTSGDVPKQSCFATASVINYEMLVFDNKAVGEEIDEVCIYSLDRRHLFSTATMIPDQ